MIVLTTVPAVPGMLLARSNVLCIVYVPVGSSGLGELSPPPPPPPPPSPPPIWDGSELQPAAVAPSARARAKVRRVVAIMVILPARVASRRLGSACATAPPAEIDATSRTSRRGG